VSELLVDFRRARDAGEPLVLATIIATEGSTYRKAGARALFRSDGSSSGMLGGGTFEPELFEQAAPVFTDGLPRIVDCEMPSRRDAARGSEWSRDGVARIFLQLLTPADGYAPLALMESAMEKAGGSVLLTVIDSSDPLIRPGTCLLHGTEPGSELPPLLRDEMASTADSSLAESTHLLVRHCSEGTEVEIFYAPIRAPLSLLIIGGGPDAVPLARIARILGWRIAIIEPRGGWLRREAAAAADFTSSAPAAGIAVAIDLSGVDAAVLVTRSYELDREYLPAVAAAGVPFIGLLGSKTRRQRLLASLGDDARHAEPGVRGPVGLDIGARTPEEIALSIVAQIQSEAREILRPRLAESAPDAAAPTATDISGVYAVVLAAGGARRYGGFKQLLEFRGESLLRRISRVASAALAGRVVVVHGPKPQKCQRELAGLPVRHVVNENWENGMALSLKTGLRALPPDCAAALVLLCDQPLIDADQIHALLEAWRHVPANIAGAAYAGTCGVPAVFPRAFFAELLKLTGDHGAREIIERHAASVTAVPMPEAELDIDTQDDYSAMLMRNL
jgi:xanthine dehydrogenase accessory factor